MKRKQQNSSSSTHSVKSNPKHAQDNEATPARFEEPDDELGDGFSASLMDGPSIDLFKVAGLEETDQLHDAVWGKFNWQSLLGECGSANIIETVEIDEVPGMSDVFYWVEVDDSEMFRSELRTAMLSAIKVK